jgi:membrane protein DedA with SNARE-associated domain
VAHGFIGEIEHYVRDYGYLAVSLGILLEDFGLPTPGETLLILGAILAADGHLSIYWLLPLAWAAAVIGDNIGFAIGATGGHLLMVRYGRRLGITAERLQRVEAFFARYGPVVIVFARFVVGLRQFNGIVAGTLEMHWLRFLVLNAIGAALWVAFWGLAAFWLGKSIFVYLREFHALEPVAAAVLAALLLGGAGYLWWRRRRQRRER